MNILTCEGVRKMYGSGNNQVAALDGIDLTVSKGEFVAIIGASGSGKSTLLHILGSVDKPTSGKVTIHLQGRGRASFRKLLVEFSVSLGR